MNRVVRRAVLAAVTALTAATALALPAALPAPPAQASFCPSPLICYSGGPVMLSATSHAIFWFPPTLQDGSSVSWPSGTSESAYVNGVESYLKDAGGTGIYGNNTQYYQIVNGQKQYIQNKAPYGGAVITTQPYTSGGCPPFAPGNCVNDATIQQLVAAAIGSQQGWHPGLRDTYFVYLAPGETECDGPFTCYPPSSGPCKAYHSSFGSHNDIYAVFTFPQGCGLEPNEPQTGNSQQTDTTLSFTSHEQMEMVTDPTGNGWQDSSGNEIGDLCAATPGDLQYLHGDYFVLQKEWSNAAYLAGFSVAGATPGCVRDLVPASPASLAVDCTGTVTWGASATFDNQPLTGYQVSATSGGTTASSTVGPSASVAQLKNLADGTYAFSVSGMNANGTGPPISITGDVSTSPCVDPDAYDFGVVPVGQQAVAQAFYFRNPLSQTIKMTSVSITGDGGFQIAADSCTGQDIGSGSFCVVDAYFAPTAAGSATAQLTLTGNTGGPKDVTVSAALTGTGVSANGDCDNDSDPGDPSERLEC